jgi:hypothetical protein
MDEKRLDKALGELGADAVTPPAGMRAAVMAVVTARTPRAPRVVHGRFGGAMTQKALIGVAAAAAVVFAAFAITGFPADPGDTQGAIGQAARYNGAQITETSANVGDPAVQKFIQSETFAAILADENAVKLLGNADFRRELLSEDLRHTLASPELAEALARFQGDAALGARLEDVALARQFNATELAAWLDNAELRLRLTDARFLADLRKVDLANAVELKALQAEFAEQLHDARLAAELVQRTELTAMLGDAQLARLFGDAQFAAALKHPGFAQALAKPGFVDTMLSAEFAHALTTPGFQAALLDGAFAQALSSQQFASVLDAQLAR